MVAGAAAARGSDEWRNAPSAKRSGENGVWVVGELAPRFEHATADRQHALFEVVEDCGSRAEKVAPP